MNGKVVNTMISNKLLNKIKIYHFIISQVAYDIQVLRLASYLSQQIRNALIITIYLANKAVEVADILKIPLVDKIDKTKNSNSFIYDPETAVKLEAYDINNYLYPITQFSYDLMRQFGFYPPDQQFTV